MVEQAWLRVVPVQQHHRRLPTYSKEEHSAAEAPVVKSAVILLRPNTADTRISLWKLKLMIQPENEDRV